MPTPRSHSPLSIVPGGGREVSDADLARALATGTAWAVAETWDRFAPMVMMMAARTLGSESEAEDMAQEVFYRVFRKADTLRDPECLRSFIVSFAIRLLKTELRRKKAKSWLSFGEPSSADDPSAAGASRSVTQDPESRDLLRKFYRLLDRLSPRDRLIFSLRHMEQMTVEEVSVHTELSISTVKRSLGHAAERLSRWIKSDPGLAEILELKGWKR